MSSRENLISAIGATGRNKGPAMSVPGIGPILSPRMVRVIERLWSRKLVAKRFALPRHCGTQSSPA